MKIDRIIGIVFLVLVAIACNNQPAKNGEKNGTTDSNLNDKPDLKKTEKTVEKDQKPCELLVTEILTTSPRYAELTKGLQEAIEKNGGQSFGISLEGSPNSDENAEWSYSKTYDFALYEVYPDRQLNTARFSFDPSNKQLYERNEVNDNLEAIDFDKNLLKKFDTFCK